MLHCGGKDHPIHYISDYKLTVLARYDTDESGRTVIETFWAGTPNFNAGPVAFPSALDAEIIRQIENKNLEPHQAEWERWNLSAIDLPQMMSILGGRVTVNVFNAYVASQENTLVTSHVSCPRMSLIPANFSNDDIPRDTQHITIQFGDYIFNGLREYWNNITSDEYARSIELINSKSDKELATLAKQAIKAISIMPIDQIKFGTNDRLALFSPPGRRWKFTEDVDTHPQRLS
ncbi:hypothetical protein [Acinetobacter sp. WZC-1]|uniref:hypothetical protein n=1 Tax=Acinetobacter sp. WZC-1 TaxID=3459034 RepID=UPI00403D92D8